MKIRLSTLLLVPLLTAPLFADPCGMVPPIYTGQGSPITRVGEQRTYVFYKDGVETFVIRPGFTGKVEEFGMLIPFPTPPAIRKVPDQVFEHVAAAVDPPEVVVDLRPQLRFRRLSRAQSNRRDGAFDKLKVLKEDEVRVLREEAVGMYEVAVLAAGSAKALNRWMDDHGYRYPAGMDKPCGEYVEQGWCFVAVKTKVSEKKGVDPEPGQREVEAKLSPGASFDGYVQAMGFRFETEELVVPMRLSAFNVGELRNIVYLLTEGPRKVRSIPEEYVVRQVSGGQLLANVTEPLPLRIIGGTEKDIPDYRLKSLAQERDPAPHNGAAKELFASDLLAASSGELALPHEEQETELLNIGERFGLRGADIDKLNEEAVAESRAKSVSKSLASVKDMTLTVVDGDFPREVLAGKNLTFGEYRMPAARNKAEVYDAKLRGPGGEQEGFRKTGKLDIPSARESKRQGIAAWSSGWLTSGFAIAILIPALLGLMVVGRNLLRKN